AVVIPSRVARGSPRTRSCCDCTIPFEVRRTVKVPGATIGPSRPLRRAVVSHGPGYARSHTTRFNPGFFVRTGDPTADMSGTIRSGHEVRCAPRRGLEKLRTISPVGVKMSILTSPLLLAGSQ